MRVLPLSVLTSLVIIAAGHAAPPAAVCNGGSVSRAVTRDGSCTAAPAATPVAAPAGIDTGAMTEPLSALAARMVWATPTGIYHCPADQWFGRTSEGHFMNEDDARARGYRPNNGRACNAPI